MSERTLLERLRRPGAQTGRRASLDVGAATRSVLVHLRRMFSVRQGHSLTVPEVRMSPDLKIATCFVMPLGGGEATSYLPSEAKEALKRDVDFSRAGPLLARCEALYEDLSARMGSR